MSDVTWKNIREKARIIIEDPVLTDKGGNIKFYYVPIKQQDLNTKKITNVKITYPPMWIKGIWASDADEENGQTKDVKAKSAGSKTIPEKLSAEDYKRKYSVGLQYDVAHGSAAYDKEHKHIMDEKYNLFYLPAREKMNQFPEKLMFYKLKDEDPKNWCENFVLPWTYPIDKTTGKVIPESKPVQYLKLNCTMYDGKEYRTKFYKLPKKGETNLTEIPWHIIQSAKCKIIPTTSIKKIYCRIKDKAYMQEYLESAIVIDIEPYDNSKMSLDIANEYLNTHGGDIPDIDDKLKSISIKKDEQLSSTPNDISTKLMQEQFSSINDNLNTKMVDLNTNVNLGDFLSGK